MTLRAGYYDANRPDLRGIARLDSYGIYRCRHHHRTPDEARACAKAALPALRERDMDDPGAPMPPDWEVIPRD